MSLAIKNNFAEGEADEINSKIRRSPSGKKPLVFTDIYHSDVNIVTWQRDLSPTVQNVVSEFLDAKPGFQTSMTVSPSRVSSNLSDVFGRSDYNVMIEDMAELVDMFCCLFELKCAGLRLTALTSAMCPKFHVDKVPCRLVTTYQGIATQWLPHHSVDRSKLGAGSEGLADSESGLYQDADDIQQLRCGDVALLKGENWYDNEGAGLVHRSPTLDEGHQRLLMTLDFAD